MIIRALVKLWLRRAVWFLLGGVAFVLLTFLPSGFTSYSTVIFSKLPVYLPADIHEQYLLVPREVNIPPLSRWSYRQYLTHLNLYLIHAQDRALYVTRPGTLVGNPEYILETPNGPELFYGPQQKLYGFHRYSILKVIQGTWWTSFRFLTLAVLTGSLLGCALGIAALRIRYFRSFINIGALLLSAIPDFLGFLLIWAASRWLMKHWGLVLYQYSSQVEGIWNLQFILLAMLPIAYLTRLTYSVLQEIEVEDYVRTARSKGLSEWTITMGHMMRNALPKLLNGFPLLLNISMSSLLILEVRFNMGGLAWYMATLNDLEMLASVGIAITLCAIVLDGIIQMVRFWLNPRLVEVGE